MNAILSPSLLSADFANLGSEITRLQNAGIKWLHLDVMDGRFVPNITFGPCLIKSLRPLAPLFFDVHLMIEDPGRYLEDFANAGANILVVHLEACPHPQRVLCRIREMGLKAGVALNPDTDFQLCRWLLPWIDMLLIMGVNPGFSGQKFIPQTVEKLQACRHYVDTLGFPNLPIQVDGGVSAGNAAELVQAGADILVSGSAFFSQKEYSHAMRSFAEALDKDGSIKPGPGYMQAAAWSQCN